MDIIPRVRLSLRRGATALCTWRGAAALCTTIVAAFQVQLGAAGAVSQDVPVPGGTEIMARSLGIAPAPERARFVAELARLTHPVAGGKNTTRAKAATMLHGLGGGDATPGVRADSVPIPLTVDVWSRAVFRRPVAPEDIVAAILSDPRAAHLCYGLAGLDDKTLQFLVDHPAVITRLYERAAAVFAAFGGAFHIHDNRVVPAGGPSAASLWEAVVGAPLDRPEQFVLKLFGRDGGRLAYLFDTIAELDAPHAAFALGHWMQDPVARLKRFEALVVVNRSVLPRWQPAKLPFSRPLNDVASVLARVRVEPNGAPSLPVRRAVVWRWVFESTDFPSDPPPLSTTVGGDEPIDAAWLVRAIASVEPAARADRLDQISFGQRAFAGIDADADADVLLSIRAFPHYRMLMIGLERSGVRHASVYAAAARRAQELSTLDDSRRLVALVQFQGALALVERLVTARTLQGMAAEALVASLSKLPLNGDGRYAGAVANWMQRELRPAISDAEVRLKPDTTSASPDVRRVRLQADQDFEGTLLGALAGRTGSWSSSAARIQWEGRLYHLDLGASEEQRLRRIRARQGTPPIDLALDLDAIAKQLGRGAITLNGVSAAIESLRRLVVGARSSGRDRLRRVREVIDRTSERLARIKAQADLQQVARAAEPLAELVDEVLAETLMSWAYAVSIADADSPVLLAADIAERHDFGIGTGGRGPRSSVEWALPRQRIATGVPWHVTGSLLGLDVALSSQALRRVNGDRVVEAPTLSANERDSFAASVALLNPFALRDRDRDAIADAVVRGRRRVASLAERREPLDQIVAELRMDGWRRRALQWTLAHEPDRVGSMFSMTELLYLGQASVDDLHPWGMSALASSGCFCTRLATPNEWRTLLGRPQAGLMSTTVPDLNLHVAVVLRELQLPAALARSVLAAAVQDFIDEVRPTDDGDWLSLVRAAQAVSRERIEDYLAAVTAYGPLAPEGVTTDTSK